MDQLDLIVLLPGYFVLCTVCAQSTCNGDHLSIDSSVCLIKVLMSIYSDLSSLIVQSHGHSPAQHPDFFAQSGMVRVARCCSILTKSMSLYNRYHLPAHILGQATNNLSSFYQ